MLVISATSQKSVLLTRMSDNSPQRQLAPDDSPPVSGQFAPSLWTIRPQVVCTIAVMSCVADLSSELMWNTQPIISCILSNNTQHETGNYCSSSKTDFSRGRPRKQYWPCNYVLFWTEICSRYIQKLHLSYKFSFANWPLSVFSVANSTWKIDRRFKQWYVIIRIACSRPANILPAF